MDANHESKEEPKAAKNRFYALYSYKSQRDGKSSENESSESAEDVQSENKSFNLTVLATDLEATLETELRKFLSQRVLRKFVYSDEGCITTFEYSSETEEKKVFSCYYCMLENPDDRQLSINGDQQQETSPQKYLLCFLSTTGNFLDSFRHELDVYSKGCVEHLDKEVCRDKSMVQESSDDSKMSRIDTSVHEYLEKWPDVTMDYMCRCMNLFGHNVQFLLYGALVDAKLQVEGTTDQQKMDILRFMKNCNLSEILRQSEHEKREASPASTGSLDMLVDLGEMNAPTHIQQVLTVTVCDGSVSCSPQTCTHYCEEWGKVLNRADKNRASQIMQIVEAFKIKYIQSINNLKRLLIQANTDYYALYKSYVFIKNSGNSDIILNYGHLDCIQEVEGVVKSLKEFIKETNTVS